MSFPNGGWFWFYRFVFDIIDIQDDPFDLAHPGSHASTPSQERLRSTDVGIVGQNIISHECFWGGKKLTTLDVFWILLGCGLKRIPTRKAWWNSNLDPIAELDDRRTINGAPIQHNYRIHWEVFKQLQWADWIGIMLAKSTPQWQPPRNMGSHSVIHTFKQYNLIKLHWKMWASLWYITRITRLKLLFVGHKKPVKAAFGKHRKVNIPSTNTQLSLLQPQEPGNPAEVCILLHSMARLEMLSVPLEPPSPEHDLVLAMLEHLCPERTQGLTLDFAIVFLFLLSVVA